MSLTRQAVMRGPSFTGAGYLPDLTPAHQVDLETGIGPRGANMAASLTKPELGSSVASFIDPLHPSLGDTDL